MNELPNPKEIGNAKAAEILLAHGWKIYPDALPYGEFFIIPRTDGYHDHQVACLAYRTFYEQQRAQQSVHPTPRHAASNRTGKKARRG